MPRFTGWMRTGVRGVALAVAILAAGAWAIALVAPGERTIGGSAISIGSTRNPALALLVFALIWASLSDRFAASRRAALALWSRSGLRHRAWMLLAAGHLLLAAHAALDFPGHVLRVQRLTERKRGEPVLVERGIARASLDAFAARIRREIPPEARILYHGHIEGMVFAYEVYPRRVFMLPVELESIARSWHAQRWLAGMPDDPLEAAWPRGPLAPVADREAFIRERGLTHEVWFSEERPEACRWEPLR